MRNMQSTFDLTSFKNLNAPVLGAYTLYNFRYPKGKEIFGKTFYAIIDGTIYGLKILASSEKAGVYAVARKGGKQIFVTGHSEYDPETLENE